MTQGKGDCKKTLEKNVKIICFLCIRFLLYVVEMFEKRIADVPSTRKLFLWCNAIHYFMTRPTQLSNKEEAGQCRKLKLQHSLKSRLFVRGPGQVSGQVGRLGRLRQKIKIVFLIQSSSSTHTQPGTKIFEGDQK